MNEQNAAPVPKYSDFFLLDLWRIVVVRKWLVLLFPVLTVLVAVLYLALTKPVFECRASILVGQVGKENLVRNPAVIVRHVSEKYRVHDRTVKRIYPKVVAVSFDKADSGNVIFVTVADFTPVGAKTFLMKVVDDVLAEQKQLFEESVQIQKERLQALDAEIALMEDHRKQLDRHIDQTAMKDLTQAAVLVLERGKFIATMPTILAQRHQLLVLLSHLESYPAQLLWEPELPEKPVRPRRVLVLLLALISGGIFGITAALITELIKLGRTENFSARGEG